jgi:hypothetical protein
LKTAQFPSKFAFFGGAVVIVAAKTINVYKAIVIFRGFLPGDPHPTPGK